MKLKKLHNLLLFVILIIFSLQLIGLGFLFFCPVKTAIAADFIPQVDIPGSSFVKGSKQPINGNGLLIAEYIRAWYKFAVAGVGILAVVMIMAGGLIWLTAAGRANQISTAKDWIAGAIVGLILALMSYTLLDILNPSLVTFESLDIKEIEFVDFGVCCFPRNGTKASSSKGVKDDSCVFKDAKGEVIETGTRCNILQACRLKTSVDETVYTDPTSGSGIKGQYHCENITKGASCNDASACPEGWFCVNGGCYYGGANNPCNMEGTSCAAGYYCARESIGAFGTNYADPICYDGKKGDVCDSSKIDQCNSPMVCKGGMLGDTCQYDRSTGHCLPLTATCGGEDGDDDDACCSEDCDCVAGLFNCKCK